MGEGKALSRRNGRIHAIIVFTMKKYLLAAFALMAGVRAGGYVPAPSTPFELFGFMPATAQACPSYNLPAKYEHLFIREAAECRVPLWLLARIAEYESGFNPSRVNERNTNGSVDTGIMQLNSHSIPDFTWRYNSGEPIDPTDAWVSVRVAAQHLRALYDATGSWVTSLAAYNAGLGRALEARTWPEITRRYVRHVFRELVEAPKEPVCPIL